MKRTPAGAPITIATPGRIALSVAIMLCHTCFGTGKATGGDSVIDQSTLDAWSAPYRNWHYWPEHVIPPNPVVGNITNLNGTDAPTIYQIPGEDKWRLSFIGFDGT